MTSLFLGGGWMLIARTNSVPDPQKVRDITPAASTSFGWFVNTGSTTDLVNAYSKSVAGFTFSQTMLGDMSTTWNGSACIWSGWGSNVGVYSEFNSANINSHTASGSNSNFAMVRAIEYTSDPHMYLMRDMTPIGDSNGVGLGLMIYGWNTCYGDPVNGVTTNCGTTTAANIPSDYGGRLWGHNGIMMVR